MPSDDWIAAAAIQSLRGTATLNQLEPYAWLKDVLEKLPTWPISRIDERLPLRSPASSESIRASVARLDAYGHFYKSL